MGADRFRAFGPSIKNGKAFSEIGSLGRSTVPGRLIDGDFERFFKPIDQLGSTSRVAGQFILDELDGTFSLPLIQACANAGNHAVCGRVPGSWFLDRLGLSQYRHEDQGVTECALQRVPP